MRMLTRMHAHTYTHTTYNNYVCCHGSSFHGSVWFSVLDDHLVAVRSKLPRPYSWKKGERNAPNIVICTELNLAVFVGGITSLREMSHCKKLGQFLQGDGYMLL